MSQREKNTKQRVNASMLQADKTAQAFIKIAHIFSGRRMFFIRLYYISKLIFLIYFSFFFLNINIIIDDIF